MENKKSSPIAVGANEGVTVSVVGDTYRILVGGDQTRGAFTVIDMLIPPGGGPGPHSHAQIEESFYVIDGEITVRSEYGTYQAGKGSFVNIPKGGVVHYFKNNTDRPAHLLCLVVPAGLDAFFQEIGKPVAIGKYLPPPPMDKDSIEKLTAIAKKYGQEVFPPDFLD